jgi:HlyD family secretion protein
MKPRRVVAVIAVLALVGTLLWAFVLRGDGGGSDVLSASGTVEATTADLGFQSAGRIDTIAVREGDAVAAGQELAWLDRADLDARKAAADAQVAALQAQLRELERGARPEERAQARAAVEATRQRLEDAQRDLERTRNLHDGGAVSREALDKASTALAVAQAQHEQSVEQLRLVERGPRIERLEAQRALVAQAQAAVTQAEVALTNATVRASFPGIVAVRHREPGETVGAGVAVLSILNPADRWVRIYVPEDRIGRVSIGQSAVILSDSHPERTYEGRVVFIASEAEFTPRNVQTEEERVKLVYAVKVAITGDAAYELKAGIPADVRLDVTAAGTVSRAP